MINQVIDSIGRIDDELIEQVDALRRRNQMRRVKGKRRFLLIASIVAILSLAGFAVYQEGLFDYWLQTPSEEPTEVVQNAIENQVEKEYALEVEVYNVAVDDGATERAKQMYIGSDLAKGNGWSDSYLKDNLIAVRAKYFVSYDHTKTFLEDGEIEQVFFLIRDKRTRKWTIWDNTTPGDSYN